MQDGAWNDESVECNKPNKDMMLAKKVRAMISNMRVMRSKAFGRFMKRNRISHKMRRHMRKEAKQANESNEANEMGNFFCSPLNPFFLTPPFFSTLHLSFSSSEPFFSPSNLLFSPSTLSFLTLDPFFFTLLPLLGVLVGWLACCNANQISTAFGENTGWCGFG